LVKILQKYLTASRKPAIGNFIYPIVIFKGKERNPNIWCDTWNRYGIRKWLHQFRVFLRSGFNILKCIDLLGLLFSSGMVTDVMSTMNKQCLLQRQTTSTCYACHPSTHNFL